MKLHKLCFAVAALVTLIAIAPASSASCNNATLVGVWGYQVGSGVGLFTADGHGNFTGSQTVSMNGVILTQTFTGTYSVSTNCTGSLTINLTGGGTDHANFVLDNSKRGAQIIGTDSGVTADGLGLAQGIASCSLAGKKTTFAALLGGKIVNTGGIAYVAQVILDGTGKVSGSGTFAVNGVIFTAPITGTYTENSNCTGTLKITPTGHSTLNFTFVAINGAKEIILLETDANTIIAGNMQQ